MAKKTSSFWTRFQAFWSWLYRGLCAVLSVAYRFFELLFRLLKTLFIGVSALIASGALMVIAVSLMLYVMGSVLGISDSAQFQQRREAFLSERFAEIDEWMAYKEARLEAALQGYSLAELTGETCQETTDCETPVDYLIRSSCPYESLCLQNTCGVVCPKEFGRR